MTRALVYVLIVIVVAGWLGTLMARDPGYVLISWDGKTLETGIWVGLGILILTILAFWYLVKIIRSLFGSASALKGWQADRKRNRAEDHTNKGLALLQAGDYQRAEKYLLDGSRRDKGTALNYLSAARAADGRGDPGRRDELLEQAVAADGSVRQAAAVARAQMCADREQWRE
ncbi:MAG: heme biosynthesis protein HemY, partial [Pseudomonadales bacterium]|nr:heme biosynthesis protein HemY [Pseudomonadales bacterium]